MIATSVCTNRENASTCLLTLYPAEARPRLRLPLLLLLLLAMRVDLIGACVEARPRAFGRYACWAQFVVALLHDLSRHIFGLPAYWHQCGAVECFQRL